MEFTWAQSGIPCANVMHIGYSGDPPVVADLNSFATTVFDALVSYVIAYISHDTQLQNVILTDLSSDSAAVGENPGSTDCTFSGDPISAGSATLLNFTILRRYRGGKPRLYLPAPGTAALETQSTWTSDFISGISGGWTSFLAHVQGITTGAFVTTTLGCVSYRNADAARVTPIFEPFVGFAVNGVVRSQRRRITASSF